MPLIDIPGAAVRLSTSERHVRYLIQTRQITHVKVGGRVRFRPFDLDAFVEANTRPALVRS